MSKHMLRKMSRLNRCWDVPYVEIKISTWNCRNKNIEICREIISRWQKISTMSKRNFKNLYIFLILSISQMSGFRDLDIYVEIVSRLCIMSRLLILKRIFVNFFPKTKCNFLPRNPRLDHISKTLIKRWKFHCFGQLQFKSTSVVILVVLTKTYIFRLLS